MLDYTHLKLDMTDRREIFVVDLFTASLMIENFIITGSKRTEDSARQFYNYDTQQLETQKIKEDYFGGVQYRINKNLMAGLFYNYYLLREGSFSATIFF